MNVRNELAHSRLKDGGPGGSKSDVIDYSPRPLFSLAPALSFLVSYGPDVPQISRQPTLSALLLLTLLLRIEHSVALTTTNRHYDIGELNANADASTNANAKNASRMAP